MLLLHHLLYQTVQLFIKIAIFLHDQIQYELSSDSLAYNSPLNTLAGTNAPLPFLSDTVAYLEDYT